MYSKLGAVCGYLIFVVCLVVPNHNKFAKMQCNSPDDEILSLLELFTISISCDKSGKKFCEKDRIKFCNIGQIPDRSTYTF
jgi:hypothetical protein